MGGESLIEGVLVWGFLLVSLLAIALVTFARGRSLIRKAQALAPLWHTVEELKAQIEAKAKELEAMLGEWAKAKQDIALADKARKFLQEYAGEIAQKEAQLATLKERIEESRRRFDEETEKLQKTQDDLNARAEELNKVKAALSAAQNSHAILQQQTAELEGRRKSLLAAVADLEAKQAQLAEKVAKHEALAKEVERLEHERIRLEEACTQGNALLSKLKAEAQSEQNRLDYLTKECTRLEEKREELSDTVRELEELREQLRKDVAVLDSLKHEIEVLRSEKTTLETERDKLKAEIKELEKYLADLKRQIAEAEARLVVIIGRTPPTPKPEDVWKDLWSPVRTETRLDKPETCTEEVWLKDFEKLLGNHGFKFPERTLRAFHTGLKCGDATPLVVLAGISGTGKSLLPELYAAAAGMNFLSVPVQPRWDGPQDLLGFYNYMEGRYKATELARFLWQADWAHNKDSANAFSKESLNIVLLDEMNLARVEYYFADFLSRLEQRRGLDLGKEANWDKASLELECGAGLDNQALLLDRNTFLIGTMNEDETTQMLSDKVIDRSNVLRFGRPANLTAKPKKDDFLAACEGRRRVTRSLWEAWREPQAGDTRYQETMRELNEALEQVGRPFAYRVQQAVDAYMAFYPVQTVEGRRQAFADQIEMKVLPKLNGLELAMPQFATTKTTISEIIKAYGDDELDEAFARACDPDNTFFKWRGVMRTK